MLVLCGSPISNYYNKVKLALLEKGVPFEERAAAAGSTDPAVLADSPLGKIPYLVTEDGALCESQPILEYIEARWPEPALLPRDPYRAAKVRELVAFCDLHVELTARRLYKAAFQKAPLKPETAEAIRRDLERHLAAFRRLASFAPYAAGDTFTMADCAVFASFGVVGLATRGVYGEDLVAAAGIDWKAYGQALADRPSVQRMLADRKAAQAPR